MTIQLNAGTVAANPWEKARLFVNNKLVSRQELVVFRRGQENDVRVEAPPELARQLNLELVESAGLEFQASPKLGIWVDRDNGSFNWKFTPVKELSGKIVLFFLSREEVMPWLLESRVVSTDLNQEKPTVKVNDVDYPPGGILLFGDESVTVSATFPPESSLQDHPLTLTIGGLQPGDLEVVESGLHKWIVSIKDGVSGGIYPLLTGLGMTIGVKLPKSRVLLRDLNREAVLTQDGLYIHNGGIFVGAREYEITLTYSGSRPLIGVPLAIDLIPDGEITKADFSSYPNPGEFTPNHIWKVKLNSAKTGKFGLKIYTEGEEAVGVTANHRLRKPGSLA